MCIAISAANRTTRSRPSATPTGLWACAASRFLGGAGDITALLDHLDHVIKKFGAQHAAIGCDVSYVSRFEKEERAKIPKRADGSSPFGRGGGDRWEHLWPKDNFETTPEMDQSIAWTNWPLFTLGMVMRGHSDEAIRLVLGGNVMRVLQANTAA